ncbi:peptidase S8 [Kangiella profundi]|uniref:Peptidase S8 n=1 Tax=Kangiella profundi TaxID=1561924 RepID=A0A2K9AJL5_9GAMM|nr:S8 family serine peptidase [Kangiella profundi]AUD77822.1 peptidase S8 [Kangiella profundi]GGE92210.1 serine protease [Kangiella profundi]
MKKTLIASAVGMAVVSFSASATQPTYSSNDELNVQNRCIVSFHNNIDASQVKGLAKGLAQRANASVRHVYQNSIKGFTVNAPCHAAEKAFGGDMNVKSMSPDGVVSVSFKGKPGGGGGGGSQTTPWSVTRVGGPVSGAGYTAWVIDTGIDVDHTDLSVDANRGFSVFTSGRDAGVDDGNGHGTHVAGTIAALNNSQDVVGIAAGATVVPVKVLDSRGSGSYSGVIAGVDYVAANASSGDCANMSLGGPVSQELDDAVKAAAQNSGAYFVLAAGNDGDHANNHSPARANGNRVYTISATDSNDNMPYWSNYGNPPVDYAAPGVSILSLRAGGGTTTMSGTSMASPAACAVIMLKNGNPSTDGTAGNDPDGNPDPIIHL